MEVVLVVVVVLVVEVLLKSVQFHDDHGKTGITSRVLGVRGRFKDECIRFVEAVLIEKV